ncbi:hypothetical protein JKF63_00595 [Porcisia hertigi]|uniref:Uncharacterized protein n=1 Tax=Porcisia hertigi TaxID=2761500 RepID=A0A836L171_9TRYP|nr:hypothetical protein JKF63_00595 [Porcisia hertigi]
MFSTSPPPPPLILGRPYTAAVRQTPTVSLSGPLISRTLLIGAAAVALGVSAVVGRSLYASMWCSENAASRTSASGSWWSRVAQRLRIRNCDDDEDDDAFATGKGAASLFDEEKMKARQQLSRGKTKRIARTHNAITTTSPGDASGRVSEALPNPVGLGQSMEQAKKALTVLASAGSMEEREQHIKLVRAFLQREGGISYDDDDGSSTSSDSTDVSLNYHLATTMEGNARDELMMIVSNFAYSEFKARGNNSSSVDNHKNTDDMQINVMIKILEYLDMANEREKLRCRRIAMYRESGRSTPVSSIDASEGEEDDGSEEDGDGDDVVSSKFQQFALHCAAALYGKKSIIVGRDEDGAYGGDSPSAMARQALDFRSEVMPVNYGMIAGGSVLDRILSEGSTIRGDPALTDTLRDCYAAMRADHADMMEDGWDAEDDDEEVELMAYLQQADNSPHFHSREEMRRARQDPANDVRIVGMDSLAFGEEDAGGEWEDEMDHEGVTGTEEVDTEMDEEDDFAAAAPWSLRHKEIFEKRLFAYIRELAGSIALTDAMAEQVVSQEDARRQMARGPSHHQGPQPSSKPVVGVTPAAAVDDFVGGDEEWEDEGDWEDA